MTSPMEIDSASSETKTNLEVAPRYKRSMGVDASHGHKFEMDMTTLVYLRCQRLHEKWKKIGNSGLKSFSIANNVQNIGVFDDIVVKLEYVDGGETRKKLIFIQCKHVANTKKSETRFEKYMNDKSQIQKWFESFVRMHKIFTKEIIDEELLDKVKNKSLKLELHKKQREEIYALKKVFNCDFDDCEFIFFSNMDPDKDQISQMFECSARTLPCSDYSSKLLKSTVGEGYELRLKESALKFIDNTYSKPHIDILKKGFCEKFRVFLNQTDSHEFLIKNVIDYDKECSQIASILYNELMKEITQHFNTSEYCEVLNEKTGLLRNVSCFSNLKCMSSKTIDKYRAIISSPLYIFSKDAMQELGKYLKPKEVLEIRTSFKILEKLKLIQFVMYEKMDCLLLFLNNDKDISNWMCARKTNNYRTISSIYIFSEPFSNIFLHENEIFIQVIEMDIQSNYFDQFSKDAQKSVLHSDVFFQGVAMKFSDICGEQWRHILDEKTIFDILSNKTIRIADPLPELAFYVERKFQTTDFTDEKLNELKRFVKGYESGEELFLFTVCDGNQGYEKLSGPFKDLKSARFFINDMELEAKNSCHLCCYRNTELQLLYSFGKKDKFKEKVVNEEVVLQSHTITIISDIAGMGKTTTMSSLALKYKNKNPHHSVYFISLSKCLDVLEKKTKNLNESTVVEFIAKYILCLNGIELHIFITACNKTGNVALFFDGVDAISEEALTCIESLLLAISLTNISRIVLSSRLNIAEVLEKSLLCTSIRFVPFTTEESEQFLVNIWEEKLQIEKQKVNETTLITIAKDLVTSLIYREESLKESLGYPLQMKMIAEIYFNSVKISKMSKTGLYGNSLKLSINDLYEDFIKLHINQFLVKKVERECDYSQENCSKISSVKISRETSELIHSICEPAFTRKRTNDIQNRIQFFEKLGRITNRGPSIFLHHRTIAEYLTAKYVMRNFFIIQRESESLDFIFQSVLVDDKYLVLRKFLNSLLTETNLNISKYKTDDTSKLVSCKPEYSSLCIAAKEGNVEILNFLLQCNETMMNKQTAMQETPLHFACSKGRNKTLRFLLPKYECLENLLDNDGNTILHVASREGRNETIELILNTCNSLLYVRNKKGESPLHVACKSYHTEAVEMLIPKYESINSLVDNVGNTILHSAAGKGKSDLINSILKKSPTLADVPNHSGETPLLLAVVKNNTEATKSIMENCSQIKSTTNDTVLSYAIQNKNIEIIKLFLKHDISLLQTKNTWNQTPLQLAIIENNEEAVKLLLKYKDCSVHDVDNAGNTALHLASKKCGTGIIISVLLREHSLLNKQNDIGETPLYVACAEDNFNAAMLYLTHIDCKLEVCTHYGDSVLHASSVVANIEVMNLILERDPSLLNKQNSTGQTPLHLAIRANKVDAVETLCCSKYLVNATDNQNESVLHYAASTGNVDVIELLLSLGEILINMKNNIGETPLELAIRKKNAEASDYLYKLNFKSSLCKDGKEKNSAGKYAGVKLKRVRLKICDSKPKLLKVKRSHSIVSTSYTTTSTSFTQQDMSHSSHQKVFMGNSPSTHSPTLLVPHHLHNVIQGLPHTEKIIDTVSNVSDREPLFNGSSDFQDELNGLKLFDKLTNEVSNNILKRENVEHMELDLEERRSFSLQHQHGANIKDIYKSKSDDSNIKSGKIFEL